MKKRLIWFGVFALAAVIGLTVGMSHGTAMKAMQEGVIVSDGVYAAKVGNEPEHGKEWGT